MVLRRRSKRLFVVRAMNLKDCEFCGVTVHSVDDNPEVWKDYNGRKTCRDGVHQHKPRKKVSA